MNADQLGEVVDVDHRPLDAGALEPVERPVDQARPPTSISALGVVTVTGRMRLPRPAARIIARLGRIGAVFQSKVGARGVGRGGHRWAWLSGGRCLSYQTARSDRTGCFRLRAR